MDSDDRIERGHLGKGFQLTWLYHYACFLRKVRAEVLYMSSILTFRAIIFMPHIIGGDSIASNKSRLRESTEYS